jgi:hypothetical protein
MAASAKLIGSRASRQGCTRESTGWTLLGAPVRRIPSIKSSALPVMAAVSLTTAKQSPSGVQTTSARQVLQPYSPSSAMPKLAPPARAQLTAIVLLACSPRWMFFASAKEAMDRLNAINPREKAQPFITASRLLTASILRCARAADNINRG